MKLPPSKILARIRLLLPQLRVALSRDPSLSDLHINSVTFNKKSEKLLYEQLLVRYLVETVKGRVEGQVTENKMGKIVQILIELENELN